MKVEQIYTNCLAEAAYYIESEGEVAIIDPLRDPAVYIEKAKAANAQIRYIFETHFHADFVSGHRELAEKTGATIVFGQPAETGFEAVRAANEQTFALGKIKIKVLLTPGHTPESACFLLLDENDLPYCIFTGDTLFIGDVGRPDLAVRSNLTQNDLAGMLYDSIHQKIMSLPDNVIIYPAHGAGSACGKNMSKETFDTLGHQKQVNYALKAANREEFISLVTSGLSKPPAYFPQNVAMNKVGATQMESVYQNGLQPLSAASFQQQMHNENTVVLDTRPAAQFCKGFVPGATFIGLDGQFAPWLGAVMDISKNYLLVTEPGREQETVMRMARIGFDKVSGYLEGGFQTWLNAGLSFQTIPSYTPSEIKAELENPETPVLDVRRPGEYESGHLPHAKLLPLDDIRQWQSTPEQNKVWHIHCAGGYRSMIAASILLQNGYRVIDVAGGFAAIRKAGVPVLENVLN
ncbi:MAG: rhodanese-like domain-containing protein [Chitinophagales bacterium]